LRNILFIAATHSHNREIEGALIKHVISNQPHCIEVDKTTTKADSGMAASPSAPVEQKSAESPATLKDMEAQHIGDLLARYDGNRKKVADALGISERTVYRKLKALNLH
jgi:transcriptional regulator with PAS, ATPase and Fis domain